MFLQLLWFAGKTLPFEIRTWGEIFLIQDIFIWTVSLDAIGAEGVVASVTITSVFIATCEEITTIDAPTTVIIITIFVNSRTNIWIVE